MRTFLTTLLILVILVVAGVFAYKFFVNQSKSQQGSAPSLEQSLEGILTPVAYTGEFSDVISSNGKLIGVTSTTINLKQYENKKVHINGEYSGNTMYADSITVIP